MKKTITEYVSYKKEDSLEVKVTNESDFEGIRCKFDRSWRTKAETINYLKWCIKELENLDIKRGE